jgi:putative peptidoglycan lipid II flippase
VCLLQYGKFDGYAVTMASKSLAMFAIGITPFMLVKILASGFYAKQNTRTPVKIGIIAMVSNMVLNAILIWPLQHAGIALATSLSAVLNASLLFYYLRQRKIYLPRAGWMGFTCRILSANVVLGFGLWVFSGNLQEWISGNWQWRCAHLFVLLVGALVVYFLSLWVSGIRLRDLLIREQVVVSS